MNSAPWSDGVWRELREALAERYSASVEADLLHIPLTPRFTLVLDFAEGTWELLAGEKQ